MTSDARERLRADDDIAAEKAVPRTDEHVDAAGSPDDGRYDDAARARRGGRLAIPLVPVLAVLLVLLLAGLGYLWVSRPSPSSVRTGDYAQVLQAARSEVVDLTSFDYQTLDEDIVQAKKITVGDLRTESVKQLASSRQQLTDQQAVAGSEVVGAGVVRADDSRGTVWLVIKTATKTKASDQQQVGQFRIEVQLQKTGGRWLLSGITGR